MASLTVSEFGGLDLVSDPETVGLGGAIDLVNVDFDRRGRVRSRPGFSNWTAVVPSKPQFDLFVFAREAAAGATSHQVLAAEVGTLIGDLRVRAYDSAGAALAQWGSPAHDGPLTYAAFGSPTLSAVYISSGDVANTINVQKWDGSAFSAPTASVKLAGETTFTAGRAMPAAAFVAVQPNDNRLIAAHIPGTARGPGGAGSDTSRVYFSEAGDPEKWDAENFVSLTPGDGETIVAVAAWREYVFVFKRTRFFVFYGNSADSTGSPVFNYRTVEHAAGRQTYADVAAGGDGVYFRTGNGVWVTNGGAPRRVSGALDPLFGPVADPSPFWTGRTSVPTGLSWSADRLYVGASFIWDARHDRWTYWDAPISDDAVAFLPAGDLLAARQTGHIVKFSLNDTTDAGTAIASHYRSGFADLGSAEEKTIRETKLWGTGAIDFRWSADYGPLDAATAVTLGTSPATAQGRHRVAKRGELFSYQAGASAGAWALSRLTPILPRAAGREAAKR